MTTPVRDRLRRDPLFQFGVALVALVVACALLAPWIAPDSPILGDLQKAYLLPPGRHHCSALTPRAAIS